ncbi:hypothetical protein B484DRAFT_403414 [Ochromonadaceae sp. CCMP2298]|nr:hypothetical protein B484DRAFT_403414 [Ochromonadaceae sp. CCMP2298]|eukprot:CAMPEP_0173192100 /NCGR_PEP_ID=MMETSP1141-20130122/13241_1 /TAXON_ID=483371 /ORGANISM="non described non described, Strain CCMP2298" /LENGTH=83 /DNA_ID=CAMNT_0014116339 /DNA_START=113 /DNA_END=364 /DNA_ORIENTATION=+
MSSSADVSGAIKDCDRLLSAVPDSALKHQASSVQTLLKENAGLLGVIKDIQGSTDRTKATCLPELVQQLERNLLEVVHIYKEL